LPGLDWAQPLAHVEMISRATWTLTLGDFVIAIAVFILFLEVVKSIQMARRSVVVDHLLSLLLFLGMLAEFLLVKEAATATFFLLLVTAFVDLIGGFAFSLKAARRKVAFEGVDQTQQP
jgi:hypothetical protein